MLHISYLIGIVLLYVKVIFAINCRDLSCLNKYAVDEIDTVDLNGKGLKKIPEKIFELKNLRWLELGNNEIETIPEEIFNLINIFMLDVSNNQIKLPLFLQKFVTYHTL